MLCQIFSFRKTLLFFAGLKKVHKRFVLLFLKALSLILEICVSENNLIVETSGVLLNVIVMMLEISRYRTKCQVVVMRILRKFSQRIRKACDYRADNVYRLNMRTLAPLAQILDRIQKNTPGVRKFVFVLSVRQTQILVSLELVF